MKLQTTTKQTKFKLHIFELHSRTWHAYKSIQPETCFEKV